MKYVSKFVIVLGLIVFSSYPLLLETFFKQPGIEVCDYTLLELPGDTAHLEIDILVLNYHVRGQFHTDDPVLKLFDLPLNI